MEDETLVRKSIDVPKSKRIHKRNLPETDSHSLQSYSPETSREKTIDTDPVLE